jgi:F-type H+-transporting ATPase subunit gamma
MPTLREIKGRIAGVRNTQKITKAMKMVAAAKLRRAQENVINARPYARKINQLLHHLITAEDIQSNPFLIQRNVNNALVVSVTADRGLCGAFNVNITKESERCLVEEFIENNINASVYCVGKKGLDFFTREEYNIIGKSTGIFSALNHSSAVYITQELIRLFLNNEVDKILIVYNEFKSIIQNRIVIQQFLPIPIEPPKEEEQKYSPNFIYEPSQKEIVEYLLPKHLRAQIWRILLESNAAELGAKMTAMDNATTNANELIRKYQLTYNKERQAAITKEILEIVSGANALKSE